MKVLLNIRFVKEAALFVIVGGGSYLLELILMLFFVDKLGYPKTPFYIATNVLIFVLNFVLTDTIVFRHKRHYEPKISKRFLRFTAGKGTGLLLNILVFEVATFFGASTLWATIFGSGFGMVFNFLISYFWVYRPGN